MNKQIIVIGGGIAGTSAAHSLYKLGYVIKASKDALVHVEEFRDKCQEYVVALYLDVMQRVTERRIITIGFLDVSLVHPREVYMHAIAQGAASVVITHNHPSGEARPSDKDIAMTQQLVAAGIVLGVPLRDHIILTRDRYFSFRERGLV